MSVEQAVREGKKTVKKFSLVEMTKKSKRPKSFCNENICRQRARLKTHVFSLHTAIIHFKSRGTFSVIYYPSFFI